MNAPRKETLWKMSRAEAWQFGCCELIGLIGACAGPIYVQITSLFLLQTLTAVFVLSRVGDELIRPKNNEHHDP